MGAARTLIRLSRTATRPATSTLLAEWPGVSLPYSKGIAADSAGYVYVSQEGYANSVLTTRIVKYTGVGAFVLEWGTPGTAPGQCSINNGIAVDSAGYVYVAESGTHRIQKFACA